MYEDVRYIPSGDCAVTMEFADEISTKSNRIIREVIHLLKKENIEGLIEWIPTYRSILLIYNPSLILYEDLIGQLKKLVKTRKETVLLAPQIVEIPTVYGGIYGPDLEYVAGYHNLSAEEVVGIHSSRDYLIYMLGFTPGFPYLGGMSEKIATPRLKTPREKIPGGSVGIAGNQTGIYPIDSPGGWQLIGKTPVRLFDPNSANPVLLKAGDYLRFIPVSVKEYKEIEQRLMTGQYRVNMHLSNGDGDQVGN